VVKSEFWRSQQVQIVHAQKPFPVDESPIDLIAEQIEADNTKSQQP
jgi:hypothetical protein